MKNFLDLLFPPFYDCLWCKQENCVATINSLCPSCLRGITFYEPFTKIDAIADQTIYALAKTEGLMEELLRGAFGEGHTGFMDFLSTQLAFLVKVLLPRVNSFLYLPLLRQKHNQEQFKAYQQMTLILEQHLQLTAGILRAPKSNKFALSQISENKGVKKLNTKQEVVLLIDNVLDKKEDFDMVAEGLFFNSQQKKIYLLIAFKEESRLCYF